MSQSINVYTVKIGSDGVGRIDLTDSNKKAKNIELREVVLTKVHYTIMTGINDTIVFTSGATQYIATLDEGNYSTSALSTEVALQLNAIFTPDNLFSCTAPTTLLEKFIISHSSTTFSIDNKLLTLGFEISASALSHTAQNIYNLNYVNTINVISTSFINGSNGRSNNRFAPILCTLISGNFGDIISKRFHENPYILDNSSQYDYIEIRLAFADGKLSPVPNNGGECAVIIRALY